MLVKIWIREITLYLTKKYLLSGYTTTLSIEDGIEELFNSYQIIDLSNPYTNA